MRFFLKFSLLVFSLLSSHVVASPTQLSTGPGGKPILSNQTCQANIDPNTPSFKRSDAIAAIEKLCQTPPTGNKDGCIQLADKGVFAQAWMQGSPSPDSQCQAWPFSMVDYSYGYGRWFPKICTWALTAAMDNCDTDKNKKFGGSNQLMCIKYSIWGQHSKQDYHSKICTWTKPPDEILGFHY